MTIHSRIVLTTISAIFLLGSCKSKSEDFEVKGTMKNSQAKLIYLEEIPAATMQRIVVDSAVLGADGKYSLKTGIGEAKVYNIRLDQQTYPVASVVNDAAKITVDANFSSAGKQFTENYEVKGSPASQQMKDFMIAFNEGLQKIFEISKQGDSLQGTGMPDSLLLPLAEQHRGIASNLKSEFSKAIEKSTNPALTMFILGYYQSTANNAGFGLPPLSNEEVRKVVDDAAAKHPDHQGVAAIKSILDREQFQEQQAATFSWVGKQAPEIVLPDVYGKEVKLSSFKGRYVLVDFWASWCGPCRKENPHVVNAYNKFSGKNFTILGVSLDRPGQKDKWLKAIKEDGLTWTHVSDLQYWNSPVVKLYGFDGIPYNVLIDPEGKVIAERLRGPALENKLDEVLK